MDPLTIIAIGEKILEKSISAYKAYKAAAADAGADDETLRQLDAKYEARIQRERDILNAPGPEGGGGTV